MSRYVLERINEYINVPIATLAFEEGLCRQLLTGMGVKACY